MQVGIPSFNLLENEYLSVESPTVFHGGLLQRPVYLSHCTNWRNRLAGGIRGRIRTKTTSFSMLGPVCSTGCLSGGLGDLMQEPGGALAFELAEPACLGLHQFG